LKFLLRFAANAVVVFLALYLVDTLAAGRFQVSATWAAVVVAILLGLLNSLVRPLHRLRAKTAPALLRTFVTVLANALVLQLFVWGGAQLRVTSIIWTFVTAAFLTLLTGTMNWLVGFKSKEKTPPSVRRQTGIGRKPQMGTPRGRR
jgi:putative membrane protein